MCVICKIHGEPLNEGAEKVLRKAKNGEANASPNQSRC